MKFIYQEHSLKPGIYKILNTHTNRIYIGQAKRLKERWMSHKCSLLRNKHQNKHLQSSFNKWKLCVGHDDFLEFHVLEVMESSTKEERNEREEWFIQEAIKNGAKLFNIELRSNILKQREKSSIETRKKQSESMKKRYADGYVPWNKGKKLPELSGKNHHMFGKTHTEAVKKQMRERLIGKKQPKESVEKRRVKMIGSGNHMYGKKLSEEYKAKLSKAHVGIQAGSKHWLYGKKHSEETKKKIKANAKHLFGSENPNSIQYQNIKLVSPQGDVVTSISGLNHFCRIHGLQPYNLSKVLHGKRRSHKGWTLITEELVQTTPGSSTVI